jgi:nitrogen fixation protein FixH
MTTRTAPFNGRHMTAILVAGFGVVIAVNVAMASLASSTFGGIVVENSYVASQDFNRWLDEAAREKALGQRIEAHRRGDGRVVALLRQARDEPVSAQAQPVPAQAEPVEAPAATPTTITATARHPLGRLPDVALVFRPRPGGEWLSTAPLPAGRWTLRFEVRAHGKAWRAEESVGTGERP